ncbi:MAG: DUF6473 family protein [Paracoccaceae bacterium]|jgi:hypothetical protein|nr:DUF6473 family protein [Paracoccaceae bacterium]MDP7185620.1 DUF6473 family protein [Paracoccaceae bacterium]
MHHVTWGASALDYAPCRYGQSKLLFRGPKKRLDTKYIAFLGGSRTYGKFVAAPYADLLADRLDCAVTNFGCLNAGLDAFVNDDSLMGLCHRAELAVLELQGITDISNRFYTVHPRRNDRFVEASPMMKRLFPTADFTEFNFTRHMLKTLEKQWPERVSLVLDDLRQTWIDRSLRLLRELRGRVVLLWMSDHPPPHETTGLSDQTPEGVSRKMLETIKISACDYVEIVETRETRALCNEGKHYLLHEADMAAALPGPMMHRQVAAALEPVLKKHLSPQ